MVYLLNSPLISITDGKYHESFDGNFNVDGPLVSLVELALRYRWSVRR